jgi:hypothetical protein
VLYIDLVMSVISMSELCKCSSFRSSLFWEVRYHILVFSRRRFGKAYLYYRQGSKNSSWTTRNVTNYQPKLCNFPKEHRPLPHRGRKPEISLGRFIYFSSLFSNIFNIAATHRLRAARPDKRIINNYARRLQRNV